MLAELPVPPEPYATALVLGVGKRGAEIDALLERRSSGWRLERMPAVDRQLLRLGVLELLEGEVPLAVVLDEAVELARAYSTADSGRFVNGVLAAIAAGLPGQRSATQ